LGGGVRRAENIKANNMDENLVTLIVAGIGLLGTIGAALIAARRQVSKEINKLSDALPSWKLLYEHDEKGIPISGTIERLIDAIGKAYPIKVKIYVAKNNFHMMDAQWVFVENNLVHASNIDQVSVSKDDSGNYVFISDPYHFYVLVSSEGHHHASRVYIDGRKGKTTDSKRRMAWFGLVPPSL
jgi:hypothetical protein